MAQKRGVTYTQEFKENMVRVMRERGVSARELSKEVGVSTSTLCKWRNEVTVEPTRVSKPTRQRVRSSTEKFHAVLETYHMNEAEIAVYCRSHGIYPEELKEWKETCLHANEQHAQLHQQLKSELREEKKSKSILERELRRKDKALAEAAALLILRKKAEAIWGDPEEE